MAEVCVHSASSQESVTDLVGLIRAILRQSDEPLTVARIRAALPAPYRGLALEDIGLTLNRLVAAHVFTEFPKHRGSGVRYWDRSMRVHLEQLLRDALGAGPLTWSTIRKRLPNYAKRLAEPVLEELLANGSLFRHPPATSRMGPAMAGDHLTRARISRPSSQLSWRGASSWAWPDLWPAPPCSI